MIQNIIDAFKAHNWLGAVLLAIPVVIGIGKALLKNRAVAVWAAGLPSWVRWAAANIVTGLVAFVGLAQSGVPTADAILGAVLAALGVEGAFQGQKKIRAAVRRKPRPPVDVAAMVLLAVMSSGCVLSGSLEEAKLAGLDPQVRAAAPAPSERCQSLDNEQRWLGGASKGLAFLGGASGIATWPVESQDAQVGLAIGAGVSAAGAIVTEYIADGARDSWARECLEVEQ